MTRDVTVHVISFLPIDRRPSGRRYHHRPHTQGNRRGAECFSLFTCFSLSRTLTLNTDPATARLCFYFFATLISTLPERLDEGLLPSS